MAVAALCLAAAAALTMVALVAVRRPTGARAWVSEQAVPARALVEGHLLRVTDVRDFRYQADGTAVPGYYDAVYDLDGLTSVWFVLTTFSRRWRAPAHTFVSFGFADGRYLALSVEARRERGQAYGIVAGALRRFELIYVIGDERDLIGRRAVLEGGDTYLYPVNAPLDGARAMLLGMVARAAALQARPEFYNSFTNNCASNLIAHVNQVAPGRIPAGWKVLVPGYTDDVALGLGLIAADGDVAAVRRRYRINDRARAAWGAHDFSARIRDDAGR